MTDLTDPPDPPGLPGDPGDPGDPDRSAPRVDPVLLEVLRNELSTITAEMSIAVERTARSSLLQLGDFATAVADRRGRVVAVFPETPLFATMFSSVVGEVAAKWAGDLADGDVILCNDPYLGASHKPDVYVVRPVFDRDLLVGFALAYSHHADIGGRFPGGFSSHVASSYEEGITFSAVKLDEGGRRNAALCDMVRSNIRGGDDFLADVDAKAAGCWRGAEALRRVVATAGRADVDACVDHDIAHAERTARANIAEVPDGTYTHTATLTDDGFGNEIALPVTVSLRVRGSELTVDLAGTAPQLATGVNMPRANTLGQLHEALHSLLGGGVPYNEGFARAIDVVLPPGTLVHPRFPGAVGGRAGVFYLVAEAVYRAMAVALPDRVPVPPDGADVVHVVGAGSATAAGFSSMDIVWPGWGGRPGQDGIDGAAPNAYVSMPAELMEREAPIVVERFGLATDSGGPGRHRGGMSVVKRYRFLADADVMVRTIRPHGPGPGMAGGGSGSVAVNRLVDVDGSVRELPPQTHLHLQVRAGQRLHHEEIGRAHV